MRMTRMFGPRRPVRSRKRASFSRAMSTSSAKTNWGSRWAARLTAGVAMASKGSGMSAPSRDRRGSAPMVGSRPRGVNAASGLEASLLVQPHVLHAAVVVERVVGDQALHVGPLREVLLPPGQHGTRHLGLEAALDLPHELEALRAVELLRLLVDQLVRLLIAVVGVVARGAALVVLEEVGVGVVEAARGEIGPELVVAPGEGGKPRRGVHLLERGLDADLVQLIGHEGAHIQKD